MMWCLRCCWWLVALVLGSVLGEPKISFHPPIYLYEFGELGDQPIHYATVGHIGPGQRSLKIDIKPFPCVMRVRFVRVVVLNAHNAARVLLQDNSLYIHYQLGDSTRSTYIVWANRAGPRDLTCLRRVRDSAVHRRRQMVPYLSYMRTPAAIHARLGHAIQPAARAYYPTHGTNGMPRHSKHRHPEEKNDGNDMLGRNGDDTSSEEDEEDSKTDDSQLESHATADSRNDVIERANKVEPEEKNSKDLKIAQSEEHEPQWKLTRKSKNNVNNRIGSKAGVNKVAAQEIVDPFNVTETVKFGLNTTIYRRTSPVQSTIKEEIIEEFVTPQEFLSQSTIPAGVSVIPGYTYQFINLPSSSEATSVQLPPQAVQLPPQAEIPKDQSEWEAYFKKLMNNSTVVATDMPELVVPSAPQ